jgi:Ricin-type beta-trefoil lectin domain-like
MRIHARWRPRLARLGAVLTVALTVAVVLVGNPASAATRVVSPTAVIPDGIVTLRNVNSGQCLNYAPDARGAAWQWDCNDRDIDPEDFQWYAQNVGGNNYELISEDTGQCLSIWGSSTSDGATVFIWDCHGYSSQIFTLVPAPQGGANAYELVNVNSGKCVAVGGARTNNGAWVIQWTCYGGLEELWRPV